MIRISSNLRRTYLRNLAALAMATGLAAGAAIVPAHAAPAAAHGASHHTTIIIVGGRGCC